MNQTEIHPDVAGLAFLLGTWRGEGRGSYPTILPFTYVEEISFSHNGKPHLIYGQRTTNPETGAPMHGETGFLRPGAQGRAELIVAQPTGIAEILEGPVVGEAIALRSTTVVRSSTAKDVGEIERLIEVENDELRYTLRMAAMGHPLQDHLTAILYRV